MWRGLPVDRVLLRRLLGLALLLGGLLIGGVGWTLAENEVIGSAFGLVGLLTLLSGGMLLHAGSP